MPFLFFFFFFLYFLFLIILRPLSSLRIRSPPNRDSHVGVPIRAHQIPAGGASASTGEHRRSLHGPAPPRPPPSPSSTGRLFLTLEPTGRLFLARSPPGRLVRALEPVAAHRPRALELPVAGVSTTRCRRAHRHALDRVLRRRRRWVLLPCRCLRLCPAPLHPPYCDGRRCFGRPHPRATMGM
jgi:hypothetical protein